MGESFMGLNGSNPNASAARILEGAYSELTEMYYFSMLGSSLTGIMNYISSGKDENGKVTLDTRLFNSAIYIGLETESVSEKTLADISEYLGYIGSNTQKDYQLFFELRSYLEGHADKYAEVLDKGKEKSLGFAVCIFAGKNIFSYKDMCCGQNQSQRGILLKYRSLQKRKGKERLEKGNKRGITVVSGELQKKRRNGEKIVTGKSYRKEL